MSGSMRHGSGREMQAVCFNIKEDRMLQKTKQTLQLERTYSMKLINLTHHECKLHQRRLKNKVSKISSHLSADEIADIRVLDMEGKLKPEISSVNLSSALRIAAASKRLKLQSDEERHERQRRAKSAVMMKKSTMYSKNADSDTEVEQNSARKSNTPWQKRRPATSHGLPRQLQERPVSQIPRAKTAMGNKPPLMFFSSHTNTPRAQDGPGDGEVTLDDIESIQRRPRTMSESSFGSNQALNQLHREMKEELLQEAILTSRELNNKKKDFLNRIGSWVEENKKTETATINKAARNFGLKTGSTVENPDGDTVDDETSGGEKNDDYKKDMLKAWKNIERCRYLRVDDDQIDLSGINTLVKNQMKIFQTYNSNKNSSNSKMGVKFSDK